MATSNLIFFFHRIHFPQCVYVPHRVFRHVMKYPTWLLLSFFSSPHLLDNCDSSTNQLIQEKLSKFDKRQFQIIVYEKVSNMRLYSAQIIWLWKTLAKSQKK
jgi:hypothetical protein